MMCVLPLLSGGISSWRQGRGNPLRHTTTHTDTGVSLDSPSTSTSSPLSSSSSAFFFFCPNPPPPRLGLPSLFPGLRASHLLFLPCSTLFCFLFCFFHVSAVSCFLLLCVLNVRRGPSDEPRQDPEHRTGVSLQLGLPHISLTFSFFFHIFVKSLNLIPLD